MGSTHSGRKRLLTPEEMTYVQEHYQTMRVRQMARELGIAWETLKLRMEEAGLQPEIKEAKWPDKDVEKLRKLAKTHTTKEIAEIMGRTENSIFLKARRLGIVLEQTPRIWSEEDSDYLKRNWGKLSVATMSSHLHRTPTAIHERAYRMNLPHICHSSEDLSLSEFMAYTGISRDRIINTLAVKHDFPLKKKKVSKNASYYYVDWDDLLAWLETHQDLYDGSLISEDLFFPEPAWLTEKRRKDRVSKNGINYQVTKRKWTKEELNRAKHLLSIGKDHDFIAKDLGRSKKAVAHKLSEMGYAYRMTKYYRGSDFKFINENWEQMSDPEMAKHLGRSVKSIAETRRRLGLLRAPKKK